MPIIKSAKKRVRTARRAAVRNSKTRRGFKNALKVFGKSPTAKSLSEAQSRLDTAAKKGVIHKNKAARLKKRAAAKAKAAGVKPAKAAAKKAAAKPAAKKSPAKKK
ncbi:MAG TPA: 30S ribosomal protein S20 [Candidatus Saccharimonadales bacterium]|nr:30S ribosomal protein S20 [Candidatus Saccharimonadales bacterium]